MSVLRVVALSGPNGVGKGAIINHLREQGIRCVDDNFPELRLGQRWDTMLAKWRWISAWFATLITAAQAGEERLVMDRCPLDSAAHLADGQPERELLICVLRSLSSLKEEGILLTTICLMAPKEIVIAGTEQRLQDQPWRINLGEASRSELERRYDWYSRNSSFWGLTLNSRNPLADTVYIANSVLAILRAST